MEWLVVLDMKQHVPIVVIPVRILSSNDPFVVMKR